MSFPEALRAARLIRAALDRSFAEIKGWIRGQMLTEAETEAVFRQVALNRLAEAELARAEAAARTDADILAAKARHAEEAARWRAALRNNDLTAVMPHAVAAANAVGLSDPIATTEPVLLREAARMLAAAAEENIPREDGVYASDKSILLARLADNPTPPDTQSTGRHICGPPIGATAAAARIGPPNMIEFAEIAAVDRARGSGGQLEPATGARSAQAGAPDPSVAIASANIASAEKAGPAAPKCASTRKSRHIPQFGSGAETVALSDPSIVVHAGEPDAPKTKAVPAKQCTVAAASVSLAKKASPSGSAESFTVSTSNRVSAALRAVQNDRELPSSTAIDVAVDAKGVAAPSRCRPRRRAVRQAERRPKASPEIACLKRLAPEEYLNLTVEEAFILERDRLSKGGTNKSWMHSSNRGFTATETLACAFSARRGRSGTFIQPTTRTSSGVSDLFPGTGERAPP